MEHFEQVIVIGAGMAGLAAAQRLSAAGLPALVVEARHRIGGRVWTDRSRGNVELGAEFIHGQRAVTWELVNAAHLNTIPWPPSDLRDSAIVHLYSRNGVLLPPENDLDLRVQHFYRLAEQYDGRDQSVADYLSSLSLPGDPAIRFARSRLANIENADVTRLSAKALGRERRLDTAGWGKNFRLIDGYQDLAEFLSQGLKISLCSEVVRLDWGETGGGAYACRQKDPPGKACNRDGSPGSTANGNS